MSAELPFQHDPEIWRDNLREAFELLFAKLEAQRTAPGSDPWSRTAQYCQVRDNLNAIKHHAIRTEEIRIK